MTIELEPAGERRLGDFAPGQFAMLYAFGAGEAPISVSGYDPSSGRVTHTIRAVGAVTTALCATEPGGAIGARGPFGTGWPLEAARGADVVLVAGGLGLPPLRPVWEHVLAHPGDFGRPTLLYGGRSPGELFYRSALERWRRAARRRRRGHGRRRGRRLARSRRRRHDAHRARGVRPRPRGRDDRRPRGHDALHGRGAARAGLASERIYLSLERSMHCATGHCGHCMLGPEFVCKDGPVFRHDRVERWLAVRGPVSREPTLAVWKLASCDGCQLSLLDLEGELLALAAEIDIALLPGGRERGPSGPWDLSLVEGSVTTAEDAERIARIRERSRRVVAIGACATAGGIQALRNFADVADFTAAVYASPQYISTLATSTPIADHVHVDFELHGCPIDKHQLLEVISAFVNERRPAIASHSVCIECKRRGNVCVTVAHGTSRASGR